MCAVALSGYAILRPVETPALAGPTAAETAARPAVKAAASKNKAAKAVASPVVRRLPAGFRQLSSGGGSGDVLLRKEPGAGSARKMLVRSLDALGTYFDGRPRVVGAVGDRDDRAAQALIQGRKGGQPIRGLAIVEIDGKQGTATLMVDHAERFATSLAGLRRAAGHSPTQQRTARQPVKLQPVSLPDGSGSIQLPAGWQVTSAQNGMVSAAGPEGTVDLGIWGVVFTPQAAASWYTRPPLVAPYGDPAVALREVFNQFAALGRQLGQSSVPRWGQVIDQTPTPWPTGKGAFIHYEWTNNGQRWQSVALVLMSPNGDGTYTYYSSTVSSPADRFARNLPVLQEIWSSWKVSDRVLRQRLANALQSMRETSRIYQEANASAQAASERSSRAWSHYIRGDWPYLDTRDDERIDVPQRLQPFVDRLNELEGYERYQQIPYAELNRY
jgi:hypothetical protein